MSLAQRIARDPLAWHVAFVVVVMVAAILIAASVT